MRVDADDVPAILALRRHAAPSNRAVEQAAQTHGSLAGAARHLLRPGALADERRMLERLAADGVRAVARDDDEYPALLREVADAPLALLVRGSLVAGDDPAVAVVGSRQPTAEGTRIARALAEGLADLGLTVVSGLARGIDAAAHDGALSGGGRSLAILGSGIDRIYPPEHRGLARKLADHGALLSELPPGTAPLPWHFPMRNRILAGLCRAVVVVEAAERSGSLITARLALDGGRAVLAVPGSPLAPHHRGTNQLLKRGEAALLDSLEDVLAELPIHLRPTLPPTTAAPPAAPSPDPAGHASLRVLAALSAGLALHADEVAVRAGLGPAETVARLLELELDRRVARLPGGLYQALGDAETLRVSGQGRGFTGGAAVLSSEGRDALRESSPASRRPRPQSTAHSLKEG